MSGGALRFCSHARHWFTQPASSGAPTRATASASELGEEAFEVHAWVKRRSVTRVRKL